MADVIMGDKFKKINKIYWMVKYKKKKKKKLKNKKKKKKKKKKKNV